MRGAGDVLGDAQAGHVKLIGVDLYHHLLEGALRSERGKVVDNWQLDLGLAGRLPEDWIPEIDVRLPLYTRLSRLTEAKVVNEPEERFRKRRRLCWR